MFRYCLHLFVVYQTFWTFFLEQIIIFTINIVIIIIIFYYCYYYRFQVSVLPQGPIPCGFCISSPHITRNVTGLTVFFTYFVTENQVPGFSINGILIVNTQSIHKTTKSIIAEIHPNIVLLSRKRLHMPI